MYVHLMLVLQYFYNLFRRSRNFMKKAGKQFLTAVIRFFFLVPIQIRRWNTWKICLAVRLGIKNRHHVHFQKMVQTAKVMISLDENLLLRMKSVECQKENALLKFPILNIMCFILIFMI